MSELQTLPILSEPDDAVRVSTVELSGLTAPSDPWRKSALTLAAGNAVAGAVIMLGWFGASDSAVVARQLPWLSVGICGLALAAFADLAWFRYYRRALVGLVEQGDDLWEWLASAEEP